MVHFSECSTVAANCKAETQIEMRDGTVEHFPGQEAEPGLAVKVIHALDALAVVCADAAAVAVCSHLAGASGSGRRRLA